jgi:hypothetical protein
LAYNLKKLYTERYGSTQIAFPRNRIMALEFVKSSDLIPNPRNWRMHSDEQASSKMKMPLTRRGIFN